MTTFRRRGRSRELVEPKRQSDLIEGGEGAGGAIGKGETELGGAPPCKRRTGWRR